MSLGKITKTVLITGCSRGIGLGLLKGYLKKGYPVVGHCREINSEIEKLKQDFSETLNIVYADLANLEGVELLWNQIQSRRLMPDILINNAGTKGSAVSFTEVSGSQLSETMQVNVLAPFQLCQKVIPFMKEKKWGRIVNLSSIGTKFGGGAQTTDYCISKFALEGLNAVLNKQFTEFNILSNTLKVGVTKTQFHKDIKGKNFSKREKLIPLKRAADVKEIFEMVYFLCSEKNTYTSGAVIPIAGGE